MKDDKFNFNIFNRDKTRDTKDCTDFAKDAFLTNPVASVTDTTGYVQRIVYGEDEAASYEEMFDVPVSYKKEKIKRYLKKCFI